MKEKIYPANIPDMGNWERMIATLEDKWIGERLIDSNVLTKEQRDEILEIQSDPVNRNIRFGDIAVDNGYCKREQIESIQGFLGQLLIEEGLLTKEQVEKLLKLQQSMREGRLLVPNLGELAAQREYCSKDDIERIIAVRRRISVNKEGKLEEEDSEW